LITAFTSIFSGWIAGKLPEIFEIVKTTWEKVKNAVMGAVNTVVDGVKAVFNFVKNIITAVIDFFKNAFKFIGEQIQRFINWISDLGKKIWEGLQKAWKFVSEIPGKIGNAFKAGWDWLTGGGEKEKPPANSGANKVEAAEVKPGKMPSSDGSLLASLGDENFSLLAKDRKPKSTSGASSETTVNQNRTAVLNTTTNTNKNSVTVGDGTGNVEAKADPQSAAVGDMAGQGNMRRKKPKVSPVSSMTAKEGPTKQANTAAAIPEGFRRVNVRGGGSKLIPVTPEAKAQVEAAKNATATTSPTAQQKPAQQPIVVPMQQPAPAAMAVSPPKSGSPVGGSGQDSKSIPSSNPDNFYTFFSAIQYNCMATF